MEKKPDLKQKLGENRWIRGVLRMQSLLKICSDITAYQTSVQTHTYCMLDAHWNFTLKGPFTPKLKRVLEGLVLNVHPAGSCLLLEALAV